MNLIKRWLPGYILFFYLIISALYALSQTKGPREITPAILTKINTDIDKDALSFKQSLKSKKLSPAEIEFSVDTFRIARTVAKRMDIDYSTAGMNNTIFDQSKQYDKLLNKYYSLLARTLKPADKSTLVAAQRAWIAYRDAENKLIGTTRKMEYSGGGSMQSTIAASAYADLIIQRTLQIFNYYNSIVSEK